MMKMRNPIARKPPTRQASRHTSQSSGVNLPRIYLFLELFVDKDIPHRSTK